MNVTVWLALTISRRLTFCSLTGYSRQSRGVKNFEKLSKNSSRPLCTSAKCCRCRRQRRWRRNWRFRESKFLLPRTFLFSFFFFPPFSLSLFLSFCRFLFTLRRVGRHEGHRLARCITGSSTDEQSTSYLSANTSRKEARRDFYDSERWPTFSNPGDRFSITNRAVVSVASDKVSIHRFSITVNLPALFSQGFNNRLSRRFSLAYSIASSSLSSLFYLCVIV